MRGAAEMSEDNEIIADEEQMKKLMTPLKNQDTYEQIYNKNTEFFSTYNPDMIEEALAEYI